MSDIVVEVRGGVVVDIYSNSPDIRLVLVDWDNIHDEDESFCWGQCTRLKLMPNDTCDQYDAACKREKVDRTALDSPCSPPA